ncbi:winged helix-turn-helix domain-containing protein [Actinomadura kijaniata]
MLALAQADPDLTHQQIADRLGVSRSTVAGQLRRARHQALLSSKDL